MTERRAGETHQEWWARTLEEAFRSAVDGTHAFVLVDMDAPMRTMDLESHRPKVRMSPDVWRRLMSDPPAPVYIPLELPEPEPIIRFEWPIRWSR